MRCENCKVNYPTNLVNAFRRSAQPTIFLCGICALEMTNALHGVNRKTFHFGSTAEKLRLGAIKYREEHPNAS